MEFSGPIQGDAGWLGDRRAYDHNRQGRDGDLRGMLLLQTAFRLPFEQHFYQNAAWMNAKTVRIFTCINEGGTRDILDGDRDFNVAVVL